MTLDQFLDKWKAVPVRRRGLALMAALTLLLVGMAGNEHTRRVTGREVVLEAAPVDPRDLLRGAYVAIDYKIEQIDVPSLTEPPDFDALRKSDTVYLVIHNEPDFGWKVTRLLAANPHALDAGDVALKAKFVRWSDIGRPGSPPPPHVTVNIGADRYFADEPTAKKLGDALRANSGATFNVVLSVGGDGKGVIKALVVNGVRRDETFF